MAKLNVTVRWNDRVVEDRLVDVRDSIRLGDTQGATISFPGLALTVAAHGLDFLVADQVLEPGDTAEFTAGAVHVALSNRTPIRLQSEWHRSGDRRFLVGAMVVACVTVWLESVQTWLDAGTAFPGLSFVEDLQDLAQEDPESLTGMVSAVTPSVERASPFAAIEELADGPLHRSDDEVTGVGWYAWYLRGLPSVEQNAEVVDSFLWDPRDASSRRQLARSSYEACLYEEAIWHYEWLVEQVPHDRDSKLRLAWARKRLGQHQMEADLYRSILADDADNELALGGLGIALARMNRLDEADRTLDDLQAVAPMSPYTDVSLALFSALQGHDRDVLLSLGRGFANRERLSEELQIELRKDIALDPALASLREDARLSSLINRHLGAAGPRPAR